MFVLALIAGAVAAAIYLAPADVRIVAWTAAGPSRIALVPPLGRLWLALAIGAVAAAAIALVRRRGADARRAGAAASPLLLLIVWVLPYIPWLPDRAPLVLTFAGPLKWIVLVAALLWMAAGTLRWRPRPAFASRTVIFVVSFIIYAALGARFTDAVGFSGDEPHYLVIAHSLLVDRDLDIANNHERRDYRAFYLGTLGPDFLRRGRHGEIYSIHAPGLPVLLLPAYAVAGAAGAVGAVAALAALAAVAIFDLARRVAGASAAALAWATACFSVPFVPHAWLIYPEIACAAVVAWSILWTEDADPSPRGSVANGVLLSALPWLHTKFVVLLAILAAWHLARLWPRIRRMVAFAAPIAVSTVAWLVAFERMYGTLDPEAPYGSAAAAAVLAANIPRSALGLLFDQKFGLLVYSPAFLLAVPGAVLMWRDPRRRTQVVGITVACVAFVVATARFYMWWGGASAPARFLVPVVPLLATPAAVGIARMRSVSGRALVAATIAASLGLAVVSIATPSAPFLFSEAHGVANLVNAIQHGAPLDVSLPTFTQEDWTTPLRLLAAWIGAIVIGCGIAVALVRARAIRSSWGAGATAILVSAIAASVILGGRLVSDRAAYVRAGRLALMRTASTSALRAIDLGRFARVPPSEFPAMLTVAVDRAALDKPVELPAGEFIAAVRASASRMNGTISLRIGRDIVVAEETAVGGSLDDVRFRLEIPAPVSIRLSEDAARTVQRVDITPVQLGGVSAAADVDARSFEPVAGARGSFMAYVDQSTYPEGGVFWTRATETGRVVLVPAGGSRLKLTLHVGPNGGPVSVDVANRHEVVDLAPGETRDIVVPIERGERVVPMAFRAARAFRPSDTDPASDDRRRLGCQVRPAVF